jgi:hypothetical protein
MEYIHHQLVLRLQRPLSEQQLASLEQDFADILAGGQFRQASSIAGELSRPAIESLSRLAFQFNRRSLGRLRQLIDAINSTPST